MVHEIDFLLANSMTLDTEEHYLIKILYLNFISKETSEMRVVRLMKSRFHFVYLSSEEGFDIETRVKYYCTEVVADSFTCSLQSWNSKFIPASNY